MPATLIGDASVILAIAIPVVDAEMMAADAKGLEVNRSVRGSRVKL
jgi:hypothetical protein